MSDPGWLKAHIREVPDFPEPGIGFKDITPLLADVDAFRFSVDAMADHFRAAEVDAVVGIEARGFLFGAPMSYRLGIPLVPIRKPGKLPHDTVRHDYELEYGTDAIEMHSDAVGAGHRVLVVDDVLATGGTAAAAARLLVGAGAEIGGFAFLAELAFLAGRARLEEGAGFDGSAAEDSPPPEVFSLLTYDD